MALTDTFDNPQSRVEAILQNAMGAEHEVVPQSRVEELLERLDGYLENIEGRITDQDEEIVAAVNAWLEDNFSGDYAVTDTTLTVSGMAADAKETGDEISELKEDLNDKADVTDMLKAFPTDTASGSVASFADGANVPVKSLIVNIDPVQSGSGDPSPDNVRPISGWTGMKVSRAGKNLFDKAKYQNLITDFEYSLVGYRCKAIQLVPNTTYAISITPLVAAENPVLLLNNVEKVNDRGFFDCRLGTHTQKAFTTDDTGCLYIGVSPSGTSNSNVNARLDAINLQIEQADAATDYEPYQGNTCTIDWETEAATVYGGKLDVVSGVLTVDRAMVTVDKNAYITIWETPRAPMYGFSLHPTPTIDEKRSSVICNRLKSVTSVINWNVYTVSGNLYFTVDDSALSERSLDAVKTWLADNPLEVVCKLATPITVQLTPHEVTALLGDNNLWADTGDSTVEYRADPTLYIGRLTEPDADMVADANITSGSYFMVGNTLYKATANIASGASITPNVNCTRKSLSEALNELNA